MHLEQHGDDVADAVESGRRRLASIDLSGVAESARAAVPERWSRPKRRSRWPLVAVVLAIGSVAAVMMFLLPMWRRATEVDVETGGSDPLPDQPVVATDPMSGWGRTSEEMSDGQDTGS